ncbi:hypothetical protein Vi05172_g1360 [Venturia inaequalis]|nr:hypothetical protein Vi05172_g1360 [Venturia inaequalis]
MKFTAVLAFLAFAITTIASPIEAVDPRGGRPCNNGCAPDPYGFCPKSC